MSNINNIGQNTIEVKCPYCGAHQVDEYTVKCLLEEDNYSVIDAVTIVVAQEAFTVYQNCKVCDNGMRITYSDPVVVGDTVVFTVNTIKEEELTEMNEQSKEVIETGLNTNVEEKVTLTERNLEVAQLAMNVLLEEADGLDATEVIVPNTDVTVAEMQEVHDKVEAITEHWCKEDSNDEEVELWDTHSMRDVIDSLVGWGYGSGEELFDYLTTHEVEESQAQLIVDIFNNLPVNTVKEKASNDEVQAVFEWVHYQHSEDVNSCILQTKTGYLQEHSIGGVEYAFDTETLLPTGKYWPNMRDLENQDDVVLLGECDTLEEAKQLVIKELGLVGSNTNENKQEAVNYLMSYVVGDYLQILHSSTEHIEELMDAADLNKVHQGILAVCKAFNIDIKSIDVDNLVETKAE